MQCVAGSCDISHKTVKELLGLTMLVYEYGNSFKLESNETVEAFLEKCQTHEIELNEKKREIDVLKNSYINTFVNDLRDVVRYEKHSNYITSSLASTENTNVVNP